MSREYILREYLNRIKPDYDYVLIDCMPSLGMITINALAAADSVIIPVQAQYLAAKDMTELVKTIQQVKNRKINPNLKIDGVLLTLGDMRTNITRATMNAVRGQYGGVIKIYNTNIPFSVKAAESSTVGQSIFAYDKKGKVAQAFTDFTKEVIADGKRNKTTPAPSR
jgi:chromosome partitioning protein